jgi:ABC-type hemin transport system substrate-binding protein
MELISSRAKLPLMAGIVMMLTGCSNGSPVQIASASSPVSIGCQSNSVVPSCIMQNAKLALGEITDPENWVSAASEYAIGLQSIGDTRKAIAILDEAAVKTGTIEAIENRLKVMILTANSYAKLDKIAKARDMAERGESLALQIEMRLNPRSRQGRCARSRFIRQKTKIFLVRERHSKISQWV